MQKEKIKNSILFNNFLKKLKPEIVYLKGDAIVPAKDLSWKVDPANNKIVEKVRPKTHEFENSLKEDIKNELKGVSKFPTKKEVIIVLSHGFHSQKEYQNCDLDNRAKTVLDALKGPVYIDDSQVSILITYKDFLKNSQESYYRFSVKILIGNLIGKNK